LVHRRLQEAFHLRVIRVRKHMLAHFDPRHKETV
jgi:hypothetical protein